MLENVNTFQKIPYIKGGSLISLQIRCWIAYYTYYKPYYKLFYACYKPYYTYYKLHYTYYTHPICKVIKEPPFTYLGSEMYMVIVPVQLACTKFI